MQEVIKEILSKIGLTNINIREFERSRGFITSGYIVVYDIVGDENHSLVVSIDKEDLIRLGTLLLNEKISEISKKVMEHFLSLAQLIGRRILLNLKKSGKNVSGLKPVLFKSNKFKGADSDYINIIVKSEQAKLLIKYT